MIVFCDMDGVLVDLLRGYREVVGVCLRDQIGVGDKKWFPALKVDGFWKNLPKMEDADKLLTFIEKHVPYEQRKVLTAPQKLFETCANEKIEWIKTHAPIFHGVHVVDRKYKKHYAVKPCGTPNILIDDYEKNIEEWENAGGIAIHHIDAEKTIAKLKEFLV